MDKSNGHGKPQTTAEMSDDAITAATPIEELVKQIQATTCTGDVRDYLLDGLKHDKSPLPWNLRPEKEQKETIEAATAAANHLVARVVHLVAAQGQDVLEGRMVQFTSKDGELKAVIEFSSNDKTLLAMNRSSGKTILMVVADKEAFEGERRAARPTPDQATILPNEGDEPEHAAA